MKSIDKLETAMRVEEPPTYIYDREKEQRKVESKVALRTETDFGRQARLIVFLVGMSLSI